MPGDERTVSIVGGGPAGVAAALQCRREGLKDITLFEKDRVGGLIYQANRIENFPGFIDEDGREFVSALKRMISEWDIPVKFEEVERIKETGSCFELDLGGETFETDVLVLATGTAPRELRLKGEKFHPEWRDYTGEKVTVIGGGDVAYDYALRVKRLGGEPNILRRSEPDALSSLVDEVQEKGIEEIYGEVEDCIEQGEGYLLKHSRGSIETEHIITAIGREPELPENSMDIDVIDLRAGITSIDDLYVLGSTVLGRFRQTSLAWGMGIAGGMDIADSTIKV